jgi:nitrogen regulatory protein P-II 1
MKQIKAIIQEHRLSTVVNALHELTHFPGITITDVYGQGRGRGQGGAYQPAEDQLFYHRRKLIEVVAGDDLAPQIIATIRKAAHTGNPGDGIIVVTEIAQTVRIRTGEERDRAV